MFVDLLLIDSKGFLNIRAFKEKLMKKNINLEIGKLMLLV